MYVALGGDDLKWDIWNCDEPVVNAVKSLVRWKYDIVVFWLKSRFYQWFYTQYFEGASDKLKQFSLSQTHIPYVQTPVILHLTPSIIFRSAMRFHVISLAVWENVICTAKKHRNLFTSWMLYLDFKAAEGISALNVALVVWAIVKVRVVLHRVRVVDGPWLWWGLVNSNG